MDQIGLRRKNVIWSINQNPVAITITRTEKVEINGHFNENLSQVGPLIVRVFRAAENKARTETHLVGTKSINAGWGLLADWQADLRAGFDVRDEFDVPGIGLFVIKSVTPQIIQGQVVGHQAELELVS